MSVPGSGDVLQEAFDRGERGAGHGSLWVEAPGGRRRLPDPVRDAAVRAGLAVALTLFFVTVAVIGLMGGTWLAVPAFLVTVVSTVLSTWAVLDVWVTRQVYLQQHEPAARPGESARSARSAVRSSEHRSGSSASAGRRALLSEP